MVKKIIRFLLWAVQKVVLLARINELNISKKVSEITAALKELLDQVATSTQDGTITKKEINDTISKLEELIIAIL